VSRVYLVRHGQAGTRNAYDALSELGCKQAHLLGAFFAAQPLEFAAAFTGTLARQEQTGLLVKAGYEAAGRSFPPLVSDCAWNEFDLADVYRTFAPQLCAEDPAFQAEYEEMLRQARDSEHQPDARVHRRWLPCDVRIVDAWIRGRFPYDGESWPAFRERVLAARPKLAQFGRDDNLVVFTSAVPIGIWTAITMDIEDDRALRLAGTLQNTSCTVVRVATEHVRLHSFNVLSHLPSLDLQTYR
jgi:broad specificity phosphatase PhoE